MDKKTKEAVRNRLVPEYFGCAYPGGGVGVEVTPEGPEFEAYAKKLCVGREQKAAAAAAAAEEKKEEP